jgi:hypothetical protein
MRCGNFLRFTLFILRIHDRDLVLTDILGSDLAKSFTFPLALESRIDLILIDPTYFCTRGGKSFQLVLTHAHSLLTYSHSFQLFFSSSF